MLSPTLAVYRNLLSKSRPFMACKPLKTLDKIALKMAYSGLAPQVSATAVLACSTAPRLGPGAEQEKRAADYPESREGYRESAHEDSPGCAALASSNCAR
jgi:hypothetical protein